MHDERKNEYIYNIPWRLHTVYAASAAVRRELLRGNRVADLLLDPTPRYPRFSVCRSIGHSTLRTFYFDVSIHRHFRGIPFDHVPFRQSQHSAGNVTFVDPGTVEDQLIGEVRQH